jgi:bacteriocin biosynthesis cyclodehydratase domain-containing protein
VWRDATTLQLGLDPHRAVVISGLDEGAARLVESLDGSRDLPTVLATAAELGLEPGRADILVELLRRSGVLDDGSADRGALRRIQRDERERLAPDLAAASVVRGDTNGGVDVLARRQTMTVAVHGAGRVGASLTSLLAAAGVGCVAVIDECLASAGDASPAGLRIEDVGARRQDAAARAARALAPSVRTGTARNREQPDLAVIAVVEQPSATLPDELLRASVPHLFAAVREGTGVVGPLVVPGRSSCHRCHDLHRSDRDPAWPTIAAQLSDGSGSRVLACDVALATAVAAHAALQVLAFLDGNAAPPSVDGTIEIEQAEGRVRRRSWSPHPLCGCRWRSTGGAAQAVHDPP